jgi:glycosyltransferase involved in cell wall biosynthesis
MNEVRVLEVLPRSAGGIGRHVSEIVSALDRRDGICVDVAGPPMDVSMPKETVRVDIPDGPLRGHGAAMRALASMIGNYDVVHAHGLRTCLDVAPGCKAKRRPIVLTVHNLIRSDIAGRGRAFFYRRTEPLAIRLSARTIAPSHEIARHLREIVPRRRDRIEVVYARAPEPRTHRTADEVRSELAIPDGGRLVVTAARLHPQKALHVMLRAVARLPEDVVLAIAGEGPLKDELRALAAGLGIDHRVRWLGWRDDGADLIAAGDVFCLSSRWEAVALAAQEAVLLGTPVVTTNVGGMAELVRDRISGRLVDPNNPEALASALLDALDSEVGGRYAAAAGREYAVKFSTKAMLDRLESVYRELAGA